MKSANTCFVVMPFGRKPVPDSGGDFYDFEKVYRVIIQRAIRQAGLEPLRADERLGSHMVHAEMFADLRDHPVVLGDLSLLNPNVFYELGIRHVMSPAGTVLMCRQGTILPFDVNLSRVIFYDFDGESLDWEVVENVVQRVQAAIENAKRRQPDSPVHALLDHVLSSHLGENAETTETDRTVVRLNGLDGFQRELAALWKEKGKTWQDVAEEQAQSPFGLRVAAHLALDSDPCPDRSFGELPHQLFFQEQYDLANLLFERKRNLSGLSLRDTLRYASSLSEADASSPAIERSWQILQSAMAMLDPTATPETASPEEAKDNAGAHYSAGAFLAWKWQVGGEEGDLSRAIFHLSEAQRWGESAAATAAIYPVGRVAYTRLLLLVLLRTLDNDRERPDRERHRETIIRLKLSAEQREETASYLRWYKVIALADAGSSQEANTLAYQALAKDARAAGLVEGGEVSTVAGRQYRVIRRFIENYRHQLCHTDQMGRIAQLLQGTPTVG